MDNRRVAPNSEKMVPKQLAEVSGKATDLPEHNAISDIGDLAILATIARNPNLRAALKAHSPVDSPLTTSLETRREFGSKIVSDSTDPDILACLISNPLLNTAVVACDQSDAAIYDSLEMSPMVRAPIAACDQSDAAIHDMLERSPFIGAASNSEAKGH